MKDVKDGKTCGLTGSFWSHRSKLVGSVFLIVATILTLLTLNGFGIFGMFLVGAILCRRGSMCGCHCHESCSEHDSSCDMESCGTDAVQAKPAVKKAAAKKQA